MAETTEYIKGLKKKNPERKGDSLEDIESRDVDNLDYLLPGVRRYGCSSSSEANVVMQKLYAKALLSLGINMKMISQIKGGEHAQTRVVGKLMERMGVVVEQRAYEDNPFRNGLYFYKHGDMAYFISTPETATLIVRDDRFSINSNVVL